MTALCMLCGAYCVRAEQDEDSGANYAAELTSLCEHTLSDNEKAKLLDASYRTKISYEDGAQITVSCAEGIFGLYLVWDRIPPEYTVVSSDYFIINCGENGFLHDFTALPGFSSFTINVPAGTILCDIRVFGEGEPPDDVQVWQLPCEKADILLLPTHADDEHLYFGGTMPYYAGQLGLSVQVAYLTNHWNNAVRPHEQLNGLWCVGIKNYPIVPEYPDIAVFSLDAALEAYDEEEMLGYYVGLLRRFKPSVVIGHDLNGEYGHGAHMLSANILCKAVQISMDANYYPESAEKYGVWDVPKTYLHKYSQNKIIMNWDKPLSAFGGKTAFEMAKEGYACHLSQQGYDLAVTHNGTGACTWFGLYRSTVGADTLADPDFMENIKAAEETTEETTEPETEPETTYIESETDPETTCPETQTEPVTEQTETTEPVESTKTTESQTSSDGGAGINKSSVIALLCVAAATAASAAAVIIITKRPRFNKR